MVMSPIRICLILLPQHCRASVTGTYPPFKLKAEGIRKA
jgi:hypothetical protein